jgi:hypothetical protein
MDRKKMEKDGCREEQRKTERMDGWIKSYRGYKRFEWRGN